MKIAVTGANGRLGSELTNRGCTPYYLDMLDIENLVRFLKSENPDIIINCASKTDVDRCQNDPKYQYEAMQLCHRGMTILRSTFTGRIIHISTDYVFDGEKGAYSEQAEPNPIGYYGRAKLLSENLLLGANRPNDVIVRTTVLYGSDKKPDFVTKILAEYDRGEPFGVPYNMIGSPTYVPHLAEALLKLCQIQSPPKIVNIVGEDVINRYEFALMIGSIFDKDKDLVYGTKAKKDFRPLKAGLKVNLARRLGLPIYSVIDGLMAMKERMGLNNDPFFGMYKGVEGIVA